MPTEKKDILAQTLSKQLDDMKVAGTFKTERTIITPQSAEIRVLESDKPVLNFCANNYLGLCDNPDIIAAAKKTLDTHGFGMSSVRFICGCQDIHKELERKLSAWHSTEDCILYSSCFDANGGLFHALLGPEDCILSDRLNHASIIDGMRLCKTKKYIFNHMDMEDLEAKLIEAKDKRVKLIVTDGSFSMDGDIAPLKAICDLKDKYGAYLVIDECHSGGFLGATGRGTPEFCGVIGRVDMINSTLGKALGGASGGYTCSTKEVCEMLRQRSRPYLFSNTLAPSLVGASIKTISMLLEDNVWCKKLSQLVVRFRSRMTEAGFCVWGDKSHPICPVMLYDAPLAVKFADEMLKRGIYVIGFCFPVVPKGEARIRVQLSGAHTIEHIDRAVDAFIEVGTMLNVVGPNKKDWKATQ